MVSTSEMNQPVVSPAKRIYSGIAGNCNVTGQASWERQREGWLFSGFRRRWGRVLKETLTGEKSWRLQQLLIGSKWLSERCCWGQGGNILFLTSRG